MSVLCDTLSSFHQFISSFARVISSQNSGCLIWFWLDKRGWISKCESNVIILNTHECLSSPFLKKVFDPIKMSLQTHPKCLFFCWCEANWRGQWKALSQTLQQSDSSMKERKYFWKFWKSWQPEIVNGNRKWKAL